MCGGEARRRSFNTCGQPSKAKDRAHEREEVSAGRVECQGNL